MLLPGRSGGLDTPPSLRGLPGGAATGTRRSLARPLPARAPSLQGAVSGRPPAGLLGCRAVWSGLGACARCACQGRSLSVSSSGPGSPAAQPRLSGFSGFGIVSDQRRLLVLLKAEVRWLSPWQICLSGPPVNGSPPPHPVAFALISAACTCPGGLSPRSRACLAGFRLSSAACTRSCRHVRISCRRPAPFSGGAARPPAQGPLCPCRRPTWSQSLVSWGHCPCCRSPQRRPHPHALALKTKPRQGDRYRLVRYSQAHAVTCCWE